MYNCSSRIRNSTPLSYKFNIFLDPTQTNYTTVPTQFTILHQHPTLNQNWIYILVQYTKNIATVPMWFAIPHKHPTLKPYSIYYFGPIQIKNYTTLNQIQYIIWSNTNKKFTNSYNKIHDSRFTICDFTPTSYIEFKIIIYWIQNKSKNLQQRQRHSYFVQLRQRDSQFYSNILQIQYICVSNINKLYNSPNAIRDFAIKHQHPTLKPNSIYYLIKSFGPI